MSKELSKKITTQERRNRGSCLGDIFAFLGLIISAVWILNLQFGLLFEIPDNIPIIGNLDEAFFTMLFISSLSYFGIELPFLRGKLGRNSKKDMGSKKSCK